MGHPALNNVHCYWQDEYRDPISLSVSLKYHDVTDVDPIELDINPFRSWMDHNLLILVYRL